MSKQFSNRFPICPKHSTIYFCRQFLNYHCFLPPTCIFYVCFIWDNLNLFISFNTFVPVTLSVLSFLFFFQLFNNLLYCVQYNIDIPLFKWPHINTHCIQYHNGYLQQAHLFILDSATFLLCRFVSPNTLIYDKQLQ